MEQKQLRILVLDDDPIIRNLLRSILKSKSQLHVADKPSAAFKILKEHEIDLLITDFMLPEQNGLSVLQKVKADYPEIEVIMISSEGDMNTVIDAMRRGAVDYFKKPFTANDIWISIERTRRFTELNADLTKYKSKSERLANMINQKSGEEIIGKSAITKSILHQMHQVAKTHDTSVMILGESGTGKELVARGIHQFSNRKSEVFGAVNMSAIPETLFESEFFGHKKGSFTGAIGDKAGWFEMTDGGTLFFDEIGEMSLSQQVKLLRVLEDRKFNKVGSQKEQTFDIRIVSATNKSIEEMSSGRDFRADLYYRLSTFIIQVAPLRERAEDIPLLMDHFLGGFAKKMGSQVAGFHADTYRLLQNYPFPGNIRELRNIVERAVILSTGKQITPSQLPDYIGGTPIANTDQLPAAEEIFDLQEIERQTILRALQKTHYNKNEASKLLNLQWNALYRRMQKHGIADSDS
jgi:DNA-binding NtrC family response regulator